MEKTDERGEIINECKFTKYSIRIKIYLGSSSSWSLRPALNLKRQMCKLWVDWKLMIWHRKEYSMFFCFFLSKNKLIIMYG